MFALQSDFPMQVADIRMLKILQKWETITFRELIEGAAGELGFLPGTSIAPE